MLSGINRPLLVSQSDVGQTAAVDVGGLGLRDTTHYVRWDDTTTAGEVTIETADDIGYTGTWTPLKVVPWSGAARQDAVQISGVFVALRHRISASVLGGGRVNTRLIGVV